MKKGTAFTFLSKHARNIGKDHCAIAWCTNRNSRTFEKRWLEAFAQAKQMFGHKAARIAEANLRADRELYFFSDEARMKSYLRSPIVLPTN